MKYDNLLRFLMKYNKAPMYMSELRSRVLYFKAINNKDTALEYREELKLARKEYLEYIKEEETGCKLEECFEKWVKEYFGENVNLGKTSDGKYAYYEIFDMWNAFKAGYEQKK